MYNNFSHCLGYLAKFTVLNHRHAWDWMTSCLQTLWANHIQREIIILDWHLSDWLRREEAARPDLFAVSESWQDQSKAEAFSPRKPIESFLLWLCSGIELPTHPKCSWIWNATPHSSQPFRSSNPHVDSPSITKAMKALREKGSLHSLLRLVWCWATDKTKREKRMILNEMKENVTTHLDTGLIYSLLKINYAQPSTNTPWP